MIEQPEADPVSNRLRSLTKVMCVTPQLLKISVVPALFVNPEPDRIRSAPPEPHPESSRHCHRTGHTHRHRRRHRETRIERQLRVRQTHLVDRRRQRPRAADFE
jgi:hypothetical protein